MMESSKSTVGPTKSTYKNTQQPATTRRVPAPQQRKRTMATTFKSFLNTARQTISGTATPAGTPACTDLFPKVDPAVDGEDCDHDCNSCVVKYPKGFKIEEDDKLYGHVNGWSTHVLVATGKTDWVRDVADEKGSLMEAIEKKADVKISNGKLMLSASNIPTPTHSPDYAEPTTVLLLPAFMIIENVTPTSVNTLISEYINKAPTNMTPLGPVSIPASLPDTLPTAEQLTSRPSPHRALILLCSQKTRDARCGQSAPLLRKELERHLRVCGLYRDLDDERPGGVGIYFISHVGGHKYSANVMVYRKANAFGLDNVERGKLAGEVCPPPSKGMPDEVQEGAAQCMWIARVKPEDCEGIVKFTVLQGKLVKPESQLRAGFDRQRGLFSW
ncbi:Sucrase/ferredoxin-like-domain-containing protein [Rhexocercosporidium sp. MPI-PUGE-AT-0058]|nr:Sucrase/ferredoxin-like-domain-containing protein [Rhexocercosporidium sp. MPI-PUGE-AT-0058]